MRSSDVTLIADIINEYTKQTNKPKFYAALNCSEFSRRWIINKIIEKEKIIVIETDNNNIDFLLLCNGCQCYECSQNWLNTYIPKLLDNGLLIVYSINRWHNSSFKFNQHNNTRRTRRLDAVLDLLTTFEMVTQTIDTIVLKKIGVTHAKET